MQRFRSALGCVISAVSPSPILRWAVKILSLTLLFSALISSCPAQSPPPANFVTAKEFYGVEGFRNPPVLAIAAGDINGDGIPDIVSVGGEGGGTNGVLGVSFGNGDGTFQSPQNYELAGNNCCYQAVALGDFNHDGHLDVAVLLTGWLGLNGGPAGSVAIYLNDGTGNLTGPTFFGVGSQGDNAYNNIAVADLNGDHKLDLVATNNVDGTISVLIGNGDGTFRPQVVYSTGTDADWVAIADVNKDGKPDLLVASYGPGGFSVLLNDGNGTFGAPAFVPGPGGANGLAIADLNGDGNLDVVAAVDGTYYGAAVFLGNGDGTFQAAVSYYAPYASSVAIGNLTGKQDLVLSDVQDSTTWVLLGNGDGTFQASTGYATASSDHGLALADLNRDGKLDFVVGSSGGELVSVALGNGDGTFRASSNYGLNQGVYLVTNIVAADFRGDGNLDIVENNDGGVLQVMLGSSHGVLSQPVVYDVCNNSGWVDAGDLNGDGKPDMVATAWGVGNCPTSSTFYVGVLLGKGNGTFQAPVYYPTGDGSQPTAVKLVNLVSGHKPAIVISNSDGSVSVLLNQGNGTFAAAHVISGVTGQGEYILAGDFNNDGKMDLAFPDYANNVVKILLGKGNGNFQTPISVVNGPTQPSGLAVGDFNHDGNLDLAVVSNNIGIDGETGGGFAIFLGNGNSTFNLPVYYAWGVNVNTYPGNLTTADVNGDGDLDLLIPLGAGGGGLLVFLGNGDGTFVEDPDGSYPGGGFLAGPYSQQVVAGDFNGDGVIDAALLESQGGSTPWVTVLINNTQPVSVSPLSIKYGARREGTSSAAQTVVLTNNQTASLTINSISMGGADPGDFPFKSTCKASLLTGADCTISITFKPAATGSRTASLEINDSLGTQMVALTGTGQ